MQPALHVGFRQVAAGGIDRQLAAEPDALAALDKRSGLALLAEAGVLQPEQDRDREVVVELRHVDVAGADAGHLVGIGDAARLMRQIPPVGLAQVLHGMALAHPQDRDRLFLAVACPLGRRHQDADRAVGNEAAVEHVQRVRHETRPEDVVDGDRFAVLRQRVDRGMVTHRDGDLR